MCHVRVGPDGNSRVVSGALIGRIGISVDEHDRERFGALVDQCAAGRTDGIQIHALPHSPVGQGAFTAFDPGLRAAGMTVETPHPIFGSVVQFGPHVSLSKTPGVVRPASMRGEHNRALLREVGYDEKRIDALEAAGVITPPDPLHPVAS